MNKGISSWINARLQTANYFGKCGPKDIILMETDRQTFTDRETNVYRSSGTDTRDMYVHRHEILENDFRKHHRNHVATFT